MALVMVICSAGVFLRRATAAWSVAGSAPGVALTSGFEEESLFALQRAAHDREVYLDTTRIPFASAYFNWLFYASNRLVLKPAVDRYGDNAIPRAARIFSALGGLVGFVVLARLGRAIVAGKPAFSLSLAAFVFFGPLVGWWAHTARPDVWALTCETAAVGVLLLHHRERPAWAALGAVVLFYAAWAFKPTYVFGLGSAILFLLLRRQFFAGTVLVFGSIALWISTYGLQGPAYRAAMHDTAVTNIFSLAAGQGNLLNAGQKIVPLLVLAAGFLWARPVEAGPADPSLSRDACWLGGIGFVLSTLLAFIASCKIGAASNYFFTPLLMLTLLVLGLLASRRIAPTWFALFLVLSLVTQLLVLSGKSGKIDLRPDQAELAARWEIWKTQAEPRFSADTRLNLPWLNLRSPPLVLAFNYGLDRTAGRTFEAGGVGGLIASGYFAALLLPEGELTSYDGGPLENYRKEATVEGMSLYLRNRPPP